MFKQIFLGVSIFLSTVLVHADEQNLNIERLVKQMIKDGKITSNCWRTVGDAKKLITVESIKLREKGTDFFITGQDCACTGARVCEQWIYQLNEDSYKLIFGPSQADGIKPLKTHTNGYKDIKESYTGGNDTWVGIYKFNGSQYQIKKK